MPRIVVNACTAYLGAELYISPVYASFNLGQYVNVTALDLVAVVVSLDCLRVVVLAPIKYSKKTNEIEKNVNYCLLKVQVQYYYYFDFLAHS